jgi:hypothetical protein
LRTNDVMRFVLLATTLTTACAVNGTDEDVAERKDGLNLLTQPIARRLVGMKMPGCPVLPGFQGNWSGAPIFATALGRNPNYCAYSWTSPTNAPPDEAPLKTAARSDTEWGKQYVVTDVRPSNRAAQPTTLTRRTLPLAAPHAGPSAVGSGSSGGLVLGAVPAASAQGPTVLNADITTDPVPTGASNCEVCGGGDFPGDAFIWFVLPPEAIGGGILSVHTNVGTYDIGPVTEQVFYAPAPAGLSGNVTVHWGP